MTVFVVILSQANPVYSETVQSVHDSLESAENEAREVEFQLPPGFEAFIETFVLNGDETNEYEE